MQNNLFEKKTNEEQNGSTEKNEIDPRAVHSLPALYNLDSKGKLRVWKVRVEGNEFQAVVISEAGLDGGALVKNEIPVREGRNIGRSNETTVWQQALMDARSKWDAQKRSGYCENPQKAKKETLGSGIPAPMLAHSYSPDGSVKGSRTLEKLKLTGQKIHVQPKIDGIRCLALVNQSKIELYTRKGDRFLPVPHIEQQLREQFDMHFADHVQMILDGELHSGKTTFNQLSGLLRRETKSADDLELLCSVKYHIYDLISPQSYETRYSTINTYFHNHADLVSIPDFTVTASDAEIRRLFEHFVQSGYEGAMLRRRGPGYESRRSWSLLKYKEFRDAEYRVIDIIEDNRKTGLIGAFVCELPAPVTDGDGNVVKTFNAGVKDLTHEESRKMLAAKNSYIGRTATVEFFELSEYGVPRFPKLKGFRSDV